MISTQAAQKRILAGTIDRKIIVSNVLQNYGRVLAEEIKAPRDIPPFRRATMDGIAVCVKNLKIGEEFFIVGEIQAGEDFSKKRAAALQKTEAVWIMTGAALPKEFQRVVPKECLKKTAACVKIVSIPQSVCFAPQAEDAKKGQKFLFSHKIIDSRLTAFLASLGKQKVKVFAPPSVAILSTGAEVVPCDQKPSPYQITDINSILLEACLKEKNIPCKKLGIARDASSELQEKIQEGAACDVFLISGGVSAGKYDLIPELLQKQGYEQVFHKVKIKPGRPLWFGRKEQKVVFGLPGNPVSTQVCYKIFVEPYLKYFLGYPKAECLPKYCSKEVFPKIKNHFSLETYYPAKKIDAARIEAKPFHTSGDFLSLVASDGLVQLMPFDKAKNNNHKSFVSFLPWRD
jgi:molybdopterin molybdotransferase